MHGTECEGTIDHKNRPCLGSGFVRTGENSAALCPCRKMEKGLWRQHWVTQKLRVSGGEETLFNTGAPAMFGKYGSIYIHTSKDIRSEIVKLAGMYPGDYMTLTMFDETIEHVGTKRCSIPEFGPMENQFKPEPRGLWIMMDAERISQSENHSQHLNYLIGGAMRNYYRIVIHSKISQDEFVKKHDLRHKLHEVTT